LDRARFEAALTFEEYLEGVEKNRDLWHGVYERVRLPEDLVARASALPGSWRLVAISEVWPTPSVGTCAWCRGTTIPT
jgi:hypothetical protein